MKASHVLAALVGAAMLSACAMPQYTQEQLDQQQMFMNNLANAATIMQQTGAGQRYYAPAPVQTRCIQQGIYMNCSSY